MASFTADPAAMYAKAAKLGRFAEEYDSICSQLRQAAASMGGAYDSEDNSAFTQRMEEFCEELRGMSDKLRAVARMLDQQAGLYTAQEEDNTAEANQLP